MIFIEVRISARSSLLSVSSHIAECRMVSHALGYSSIQACCDNCQGAALASALHSHILSIPFWERGKEVDAAHQSLIHMAHVVAVLIFQAIGKISPVCIVESLTYLQEGFGRKTWVEAMDFYLEANESVLCIILVAQRFLDGLNAGSRRGEHHGMVALAGILGIEKIAIHHMSHLIYLKFYEIAIYLIGTVFLGEFLGVAQGNVLQFILRLLPETVEILRFLGIRLNLIHRESHFHMMLIGFAIELIKQAQISETWSLSGSHVHDGAPILQSEASLLISLEQVIAYFILHLAVTGNSILIETYFHLSLLASLIEPVSMIGHGKPKIITLVRIVLCLHT